MSHNALQPAATARSSRSRWVVAAQLLAILAGLFAALLVPPAGGAEGEPEPPGIYASGAVVLSDFNQIYYDLNAHMRVAPASTTKMMTAIVAVRYGDLDMQVTVEDFDLVGESTMGLWAGEQLTLHDLLYGMLLPSGNDAAMTVAHAVGQRDGDTDPQQAVDRFVGMMNDTAREFQLQDTHFMNPHGLDQYGHYSSPFDLAIILRAALREPVIREVMQTRSINVATYHDLYNGNRLLGSRDDILGGKTGFTDNAGFCLASAAYRDGRFVIAVVVLDDGDNWFNDVSNLLDWGLDITQQRALPAHIDDRLIGTQFNQYPWMLHPAPVLTRRGDSR